MLPEQTIVASSQQGSKLFQQQHQQQTKFQQIRRTNRVSTINTTTLPPISHGSFSNRTNPTTINFIGSSTPTTISNGSGGGGRSRGRNGNGDNYPDDDSVKIKKPKQKSYCYIFFNTKRWLSFQDNLVASEHRKDRRIHGLQLPLHPLQLIGWIALIGFGLATFFIVIPGLATEFQQPIFGLLSGLYLVHAVTHLAALLIDPADKELRKVHRKDRQVPEFDRTKHSHVIENGRCHLCNIKTTNARTKHCSVCNKCVGKFDHHCKWLNHCVGQRNYVAFLMCVVSAVVACLVILAAVISELVFYYVHPEWLSLWSVIGGGGGGGVGTNDVLNNATNGIDSGENATRIDSIQSQAFNESFISTVTSGLADAAIDLINATANTIIGDNGGGVSSTISATTTSTTIDATQATAAATTATAAAAAAAAAAVSGTGGGGGIGLHDTVFLIFIAVLGILAAVTVGLLLHLCFFHVYISFLGLTTYEYIRNQRQNAVLQNGANANSGGGGGGGVGAGATSSTSSSSLSTTGAATLGPSSRNNSKNLSSSIGGIGSLRRSANRTQLYFCSSVNGTVDGTMEHINNGTSISPELAAAAESYNRPKSLHCCDSSAVHEFHQYQQKQQQHQQKQEHHKSFFMCSMLEENEASLTTTTTTTTTSLNSKGGVGGIVSGSVRDGTPTLARKQCESRRFHCCSEYKQIMKMPLSDGESTVSSISSAAGGGGGGSDEDNESYMQFTEQCTFCSFKMKNSNKSDAIGAGSSIGVGGGGVVVGSIGGGVGMLSSVQQDKRCCLKTITKHHRWKRKWNCCSSVPDSPDVPIDVIRTVSEQIAAQQHREIKNSISSSDVITNTNTTATVSPTGIIEEAEQQQQQQINGANNNISTQQFIATTLPRIKDVKNSNNSSRPPISPAILKTNRPRLVRPWPVVRFRHMLRMIGRYRRPHCVGGGGGGSGSGSVRHHHHQHHHVTSLSSSSLNSSSAISAAALIKQNQVRPLSASEQQQQQQQQQHHHHQQQILPTSIIRDTDTINDEDDDNIHYHNHHHHHHQNNNGNSNHPHQYHGGMTLPALPPPPRRKIRNPTDLQELADSLTFVQQPRYMPNNRRQRRKNVLRNRSPTLSPIHESGLSNPTSPQPCRHSSSNCSTITLSKNVCGSSP